MRRSIGNRVFGSVDIVVGVGGHSADLRGATDGAGSRRSNAGIQTSYCGSDL